MDVPTSPRPREFAEALSHARAERGVSLDQIIARTKISRRVLEAMEKGSFEVLPDRVFVRMFLRQYLAIVGLRETEWLSAFDSAWETFRRSSQPFPAVAAPPVKPRRVGPWLAGLVLIAAAAAMLLWLQRGRTAGPEAPALPVVAAALTPIPSPAPTPAPTPAPAESEVLVIRTGAAASWVEVRLPGGEVQQRLLASGQEWRIDADGHGVDLVVGNGGTVEVEYLGHRRGPLGRDGQVVRTHVGPTDS